MTNSNHKWLSLDNRYLRFLLAGILVVIGFAAAMSAEAVHQSEVRGLQLAVGWPLFKTLAIVIVGGALVLLLIRFAEIAIALLFLVGLVKGESHLASMPVDLTLFVAGIIAIGLCTRLLVSGRQVRFPKEYFFYIVLLSLMIFSLTYAPDFSAGVDKILKFVFLTGAGIVAPFVVFDSAVKIRRFLATMAIGGILLAANAMTMLGGSGRLVAPSGLNTELGDASAISLLIIWGLYFGEWPAWKRILTYPVVALLAIALVGSGGRFANVSTVICIAAGTLLCRRLVGDLTIMGILGALALPFTRIPAASFEYLASLAHPTQAMGTRNALLALGVKMSAEHPLFGVGISGFRFLSPNPHTYNFPHNLILELAAEMGFLAAVAYLGILFCAFRETFRQLKSPAVRYATLVRTVLMLLIFVFLDAMVSGDINDLRLMWFVFALPFVLRNLGEAGTVRVREVRQTFRTAALRDVLQPVS